MELLAIFLHLKVNGENQGNHILDQQRYNIHHNLELSLTPIDSHDIDQQLIQAYGDDLNHQLVHGFLLKNHLGFGLEILHLAHF